MSNKSLLEFNSLEKDYLKWCKEYFAYKVLTFDKDSVSDDFDVVEMEEKIKSDNITNLEELHEVGGGVIAALAGGTQIQLKIGNEHRAYLLYGYVRYVVLALDKFSEVAAGHFILAVGRYRLGYAHKLLHIVIVLLEQ